MDIRKKRISFDFAACTAIILFFAFFYFNFSSRRYVSDSLIYAAITEHFRIDSFWFVNPHHLLYSILGAWVFKLANLLGLAQRAVFCLQFMNSLLGIAGLLVFYFLAKKILQDNILALASASILGCTYGYWYFAVSAEPYALINFYALVVFSALYLFLEKPGLKSAILAGVSCALATFFQQVAVLSLLALCIAFFTARKYKIKELVHLFSAVIIAILIVGCVYLFFMLFIFKFNDPAEMVRWLLGYGREYFSFGWDHILKVFYGQYRCLWGGDFIKRLLLGQRDILLVIAAVSFVVSNIILLALAVFVPAGLKKAASGRIAFRLIFSWLAVYWLFFSFYAAGEYKFYAVNLGPLILLAMMGIAGVGSASRSYRPARFLAAGFFVMLFGSNFFGSVIREKNIANNEDYRYAMYVRQKARPEDLLIFSGVESNAHLYLEYFPQKKLNVKVLRYAIRDPDKFRQEVDSYIRSGRSVYIVPEDRSISSASIFPSFGKISGCYSPESDLVRGFLDKYNYSLVVVDTYKGKGVYAGNRIYKIIKQNNGR